MAKSRKMKLNRIKTVLVEKDLSQKWLAEQLGKSFSTINAYCCNRQQKNWIYFVESVTSVGPMDPKRINEIESMTKNVSAGKIYVTAFFDFATFKKFSEQLAWETEVWIADMPDHMIHLNGDKFLGPR